MEQPLSSAPRYLVAADNHNLGNSGTSWLDPESWETKFQSAGKFIKASLLAGYNGFANTARMVGSWAGMETEQQSTLDFISGIDSDLGIYYRNNSESVELAGFIAGSVIPGLAGTKILNMGQKALQASSLGMMGGNIGKAVGLLAPNVDKYVKLSAAQINSSLATSKLMNARTVQALGAGAWQGVLEGFAAEAMIQATMAKNPIVDQQTAGDVAWNMFLGGAVGGVVSGAFTAPGVFGKLKQAVGLERKAREPFTNRAALASRTSPDEAIIQMAWDAESSAIPMQLKTASGELIENNYAVNQQLYTQKITKDFQAIRTGVREMSGQDNVLGNMVANISQPAIDPSTQKYVAGYAQNYFDNFAGAKDIVRATAESSSEKAAKAARLEALAKGLPEEDIPMPSARWIRMHGESAGAVFDDLPIVLSAADYAASPSALLAQVEKQGFTISGKNAKLWSVLDLKGPKAHLEAEYRYIWARHSLSKSTGLIKEGTVVSEWDFPVLQALFNDKDEAWKKIKIQRGEGPSLEMWTPGSKQELFEVLKENKMEAASRLMKEFTLKKGGHLPVEQAREMIPSIVDTKLSRLDGDIVDDMLDFFANDANLVKYMDDLKAKGLITANRQAGGVPAGYQVADELVDPILLPKHAKIVYAGNREVVETTPAVADAMAYYAGRQKIYEQEAKMRTASVLGQDADGLPDKIPTQAWTAKDHASAGAGLISFANGNYGSLGSYMQWIGNKVQSITASKRKQITEELTGPLTRLGQNLDAAVEFESINRTVASSGKQWKLWKEATDNMDEPYRFFMLPREAAVAIEKSGGELVLDDFMDQAVKINNRAAGEAIEAHIQIAGKRTDDFKVIHAGQGKTDEKFSDVFRPIRPDLSRYKHFAFVYDDNVAGTGHVRMIHAASEEELVQLADKVPPKYRVAFKTDVEAFKKARGEYEFNRTLHESYLDSDLANKGVFSNFFPKTEPQKIVDDILGQHLQESDTLVRETVRYRYENEFSLLEDLGKNYSRADTSQFASVQKRIEGQVQNPYFDHIKTALNINKASEYPLINGANKLLDEKVSQAVRAINRVFDGATSPAQLEAVNASLDRYGMKPAFYDAATQALANHTAPKGVLTKFIRDANAILARFVLGLDPFNAVNNAIGSNILRMTELKSVIRGIEQANPELVGELAKLGKIGVPGMEGQQMWAPTKMVAKAIGNFWQDNGVLMKKYKDMGLIKDLTEQLKLLADDFTLQGTESAVDLGKRTETAFRRAKDLAGKAGEVGEKATGNKLAEEFNRFITANVMDQITEVAKKAGVMDDAQAKAYINTFVNRVEGNLLATQRPLVFQGPIGQAIGLFQSYQFNLMQQMFRYVAEGSKKDLAMLAGLQSTFYGLNSMPAFQFVNVHVLGKLSGNQEHRDAYDAVYGIAGQTAGDFILYGLPSNILHAGIYSRGDINPRQITVLPTSLAEIPLVQSWGRFLGAMGTTLGQIAGGGEMLPAIIRGLEHNGISRPLAGFAQVARGFEDGNVFSTQRDGSLLWSHDLASLSSVVRLAGARPFDEAITNDAMFRVKTYEAVRKERMKSLGETVKLSLYNNGQVPDEQMQQFAEAFVQRGGKQAQFNQWMMRLYKDTNVEQAEALRGSLTKPFAYKMQLLMGGDDEGVEQ